jgi:hypothetical protein
MKKILLTSLLSTTINLLLAGGFENVSIGAGLGYSNYAVVGAEGFLQGGLRLWNRPLEAKAGVSYFPYKARFQQKDDLKTESVGLFAEGVYYPFYNYLFAGLRWEVINFNWFPQETLQVLESNMSSITFTGSGFYGVVGVAIPLGKSAYVNIYAMPGLQQYKVLDGSFSSGNYATGSIQESHVKFSFRAFASITIRLYSGTTAN